MSVFTAITVVGGGDRAQALAEALEALEPAPYGLGVFEIEDGSGNWEIGAYFAARPDAVTLAILAAVYGAQDFAISRVEDRDWVAQVRRELTPVHAGRFVVYGGHDAHAVPPQAIGLRIEAAMAFGTGHHGTTRGCLLLLDGLARQGLVPRIVADIGCGTGVLAMAAARRWRCRCVASDIDPVAVATARENLRANHVGALVQCLCAPGFAHPHLRGKGPFDLVLANILAGPLKRLAPDIRRHMHPRGRVILSGILNTQARGVDAVFAGHGLMVERRIVLGEWTSLLLRRG